MASTTILITGAGAPGIAGTISCLRNNPDKKDFRIITTDIQENPVGAYLSDIFYQVPTPGDKNYIPFLETLVRKENIQVIIPQTTRELYPLALNEDLFTSLNCTVLVSSPASIKQANDKFNLIQICQKEGLPYPSYHLIHNITELKEAVKELGYPEKKVVVKPRDSNGMRGVRILSEKGITVDQYLNDKPDGLLTDLPSFLKIFESAQKNQFPELLVTEYLSGAEYSVDILKAQGKTICMPRLRTQIRSGISFETETDLNQTEMINYSTQLAGLLNLRYCFGFQFKLDDKGIPKILESNPRVQGTMEASAAAGVNMIYYAVQDALGEEIPFGNIKPMHKLVFKRYWGGCAVNTGTKL